MNIQKFFFDLLLIFALSFITDGEDLMGCTFVNHLDGSRKKGEDQIEVLKGRRFEVQDNDDNGYTYNIGICTDAFDPVPEGIDVNKAKGAGVIQRQKKGDPSPKMIGYYNKADIMAGPEWVILTYTGGDKYGSHCKNDTGRRAQIMFICDPDKLEEEPLILEEQRNKTESCYYLFEIGTSAVCRKQLLKTVEEPLILEEQRNKTESCYYLFEIGTSAVCPKQPLITVGLSVGTVLLIVFFSLAAVYFVGGFLYKRFAMGAKGLEQIPNYRFWEDFGNLQADGCDLVCRSRKSREPKTYKGIGDDLIQEDEERTHDEHLLPM